MPIALADAQGSRAGPAASHVYGLDLIRFVAALGVALFHFSWQFQPLRGLPPVGWVGVEIFFVLSGLVIASSTTNATAVTFLERRFMRLYPTAWACTILSLLAILVFGRSSEAIAIIQTFGPPEVVASFTLIGGNFVASAYWTLPIELSFYAMVLALIIVGKADRLETLGKALIVWSTAYVAVYAASKVAAVSLPWLELDYGKRNMTLLRHGHYFGMGILMWLTVSRGRDRRRAAWIGLAVVTAFAEIACRSQEIVARAGHTSSPALVLALAFATWLGFCALMVAAYAYKDPLPLRASLRPQVRTLGLVSYPFYLLHESVGGNVMGALVLAAAPPAVALAGGMVATLLASLAVVSIWEPGMKTAMRRGFGRLRFT